MVSTVVSRTFNFLGSPAEMEHLVVLVDSRFDAELFVCDEEGYQIRRIEEWSELFLDDRGRKLNFRIRFDAENEQLSAFLDWVRGLAFRDDRLRPLYQDFLKALEEQFGDRVGKSE